RPVVDSRADTTLPAWTVRGVGAARRGPVVWDTGYSGTGRGEMCIAPATCRRGPAGVAGRGLTPRRPPGGKRRCLDSLVAPRRATYRRCTWHWGTAGQAWVGPPARVM